MRRILTVLIALLVAGPAARASRLTTVALGLVLAWLFHLWDGRTLEVREYLQHGDEYVVTLPDGATRLLRQAEVREVVPGERAVPGPAPAGVAPPGARARRND